MANNGILKMNRTLESKPQLLPTVWSDVGYLITNVIFRSV